jgi:hypothetical protein
VVGVPVCVGVVVGVPVCVGVVVGVPVCVGVMVGVKLLVGVGVISTALPTLHPCVSIILITKLVSSYGDGTSNSNGNTDTVETNTQFALNESQ